METRDFAEERTRLAQSVVDHVGTDHAQGVAPAAMAAAFVAVCRSCGLTDLGALVLLQNALERVEATPRIANA